MLKATILGQRRAGLVETSTPEPSEDWALVKVHAAPMCAEYKEFVSGSVPSVMGHEAAGEVVAVAKPGRVNVGDRVVAMPLAGCGQCALCRSGDYIHCAQAFALSGFVTPLPGRDTMAQYLLKLDWLLMPIPEEVSYEHASLACCALGPSFGAFTTLGLSQSDTLLITGAGPVGLGAVLNARYRGVRTIVVEAVPWRVERARALGAEVALDPKDPDLISKIRALTAGIGVDCALECSGNVLAERCCVDATRSKGKIAFVGECYQPLQLQISPDMIRKGLTLIGNWHYNLKSYPGIIEVIRRSPDIDRLISHCLPMSRIQEAFEQSASHDTAKIILNPWQ